MKEILLSVLAGLIIGMVFKVLRLPLPAPPVLAGVVAVFGVYAGGVIASWLFKI
ncbi:XapX domain-containing protein [Desertibacillus haloalkaliphilus]|uniref:XapX domain-containing protein n=1 Tax=Desertibacillus haloalkaliphilus TaxID=1328930 RepID=UPI001C26FDFF|nr:XapX domain-containing protein [Desertibacillus haloalkaliphilus]MBU8907842.1 XapX domain-containing protein [Desertibacillus haloalkaliphilus]